MTKRIDLILSQAIVDKGLISRQEMDALLKDAETANTPLQVLIATRRLLPERDILNILSEKTGLAVIDIKALTVQKAVLDRVPVKVASYYHFMPTELKGRVLTVAVPSPLDIKIQDEIRTQLGLDIEMVLASEGEVSEGLKKYYGFAAETLEKMMAQAPPSARETQQVKVEDLEKLAEDASVIRLVNQMILDAWRKRATDIHIEPYRDAIALRYRVDGLLYDANLTADMRSFVGAVISRIKIMSNLNIVERRLPQDGRAVVKVGEQVLDLRISTMPTPYGESVVIRILPSQMLFSLEKLGLAKKDLQLFESFIQKPHGIIFVTGPTGSGKTTTLYASLNRINTKERKIITIEDPIEYEMPGITQIQVMPEIGLDFARGLRSMLRHDPDVIMVGEVRDLETAEIAIRVALTGHLVFSTLHTNDAASGITRLVDIGLEPYLVASSVEAFIAQRLIRLTCPDCKAEDTSVPRELKELIARDMKLASLRDVKIMRGKGCNSCNATGFFGRTAIYEILNVDDAIKELILKKTTSNRIKASAIERGMRTLRQDGWQKVLAGLTTPEEVMKVTPAEAGEETALPHLDASLPSAADSEHEGTIVFDRRTYRRLITKVNIRYRTVSTAEATGRHFSPELLSVTHDISAGGLVFISDEPPALGNIIELKIELPNGDPAIECLARVVRAALLGSLKYDVAICFLDITGSDRARLDKFVDTEG